MHNPYLITLHHCLTKWTTYIKFVFHLNAILRC